MEESVRSGVLLAGEGVRSSRHGARLTVEDGKVTVTDGPFAEAKELIAGFAILDVKSKDEAIEHAKRFARIAGVTKIDIRRVAEFSDFE
ncbi:MAG TPA: YciI family protein, partial [Acidimicrobiales bacterium]